MNSSRDRFRRPRGTSTLELILVLPTLLFMMFAIVELSRMWLDLNVVTQAAREGARVAVVTPVPSAGFDSGPALARISAVLAGANLTSTSASVTCAAPCAQNSQVTATVTVNFQTLFPVFLPWWSGAGVNITDTAVMRYE